jgi:hypothetical protein
MDGGESNSVSRHDARGGGLPLAVGTLARPLARGPRSAAFKLAGALLLAVVAHATPGLAGDRLEARFEIFGFAGLHVLTDRTIADETPSGYALATNLSTRGLAGMFVDLRSHSEVYGTLPGKTPRPESYHAEIWRNGVNHAFAVKYLNNGDVINMSAPPSDQADYLHDVQARGTVDQLTAYFLLERQVAQIGSCRLVVPVFDGEELYRLRFSDVRQETLPPDDFQNFTGPTQVCEVVREMIVANPDRTQGTYERGRLWYARLLPANRVVPVRMEYETLFGSVKGYLAEVSGYGAHLRFIGE